MRTRMLILTIVLGLALGMAGPAWASCTTHSYVVDGRIMMCSTCCTFTHCTTTCI